MQGYNQLTIDDIEQALRKIEIACNKAKYEGRYVIGFADIYDGEDGQTGYVLGPQYNVDGKPVVLLKPNGKIHKALIEQEEKLGVHIERLSEAYAKDIFYGFPSNLYFTDEFGVPYGFRKSPTYNPFKNL